MSPTIFGSNGGFGSPSDDFGSTAKSISSTFAALIVVGVIASMVIIIVKIYCIKKIWDSMQQWPQYAQLTIDVNNPKPDPDQLNTSNKNPNQLNTSKKNPNQVYAQDEPTYLTVATMEQFLRDIEGEKPIRFSSQELTEITQNFSQVLGSGGFGVVYKGVFPNGVEVAVKLLKDNTSKRVEEQFMAEVGSIGRTYHINLVRLYGFCFDSSMRALIYEYTEKGSLDKHLFGDQRGLLEFSKLHAIAIGTARGIAYLHEECQQRIIHYDIKPGNVLLDTNLNPKVADFGLAKLCNQDSTHIVMSGYRGTPGYAAPELWTPYPVTDKCDVYSFGMFLFEIVGRRRNHDANLSGNSQVWLPRWAYDKFNKGELLDMLSLVGIPEEDRENADRMVKVALWCVQHLPKARPMMSSVVKMLEGDVKIDTPPNPFDHLDDNLDLGHEAQGNSSSQYSSSTLNQSNLLQSARNNKLEIEIATI